MWLEWIVVQDLAPRSSVLSKQKVERLNLSEGIFLLNFVIIYILLDKL